MFKIGDYIAHPMHGAGVIESIVTKKINGAQRDYYVLKLPVGDMVVMVPVAGCEDIGVRSIISRSEAENVFNALRPLSKGLCAGITSAAFLPASVRCSIRQSRY